LIVDDELGTHWIVRRLLASAGRDCISAFDGASAVKVLRCAPVSLILLDAKLPDVEGLDLAVQLRNGGCGVPIILMSAYFYPDDPAVQAALAAGIINDFIAKPFRHRMLRESTERALAT
jgi:DNA-binding response OmpR family regulator